ncbi:MAG: hypothetical protein ACRD4E_01190, partial [Bryobacteraceae bacterium]
HGRLLDPLRDGRALAFGVGVEDMRKIRARVPRANVVALRSAEGILGTEVESPPEAAAGEELGNRLRHPATSDEFPISERGAAVSSAAPAGSVTLETVPPVALLTPEILQLFGGENRIVVIRPDGYLGFRGSLDDLARLDDYARLTGLA